MGKIKSTLEIAMERADALAAGPSDVEDYQQQQIKADAETLVSRFLEDPTYDPRRLNQFLSRYSGELEKAARDTVCALLVAEVRPDRWSRAMVGLSALCPFLERPRAPQLWSDLETVQEETERLVTQKIAVLMAQEEQRRRAVLEEVGIRGSAVVVAPSLAEVNEQAMLQAERTLREEWEAIRRHISERIRSGEEDDTHETA